MVYGQRPWAHRRISKMHDYTTAPIKAWTSPASSAQQVPSGILLRVIATTAMAVFTMSVTAATIGLPLLTTTTRTA